MPILKENRSRYPKDWKRISYEVRSAAGWKCEWCGVKDRHYVIRNKDGEIIYSTPEPDIRLDSYVINEGFKAVQIVLTVAHLNHKPEDCRRENLKALCQRDHNRWDSAERQRNRKKRARKKLEERQLTLLGETENGERDGNRDNIIGASIGECSSATGLEPSSVRSGTGGIEFGTFPDGRPTGIDGEYTNAREFDRERIRAAFKDGPRITISEFYTTERPTESVQGERRNETDVALGEGEGSAQGHDRSELKES